MSNNQLSSEIKKISDKTNCGSEGSYAYSPASLLAEQSGDGYPYIDEVIYREWNESIIFKSTSTVFHRVGGQIKWYKSKSDGNQGNPIFIDDVLNDTYWEPIIDFYETNVFVNEFTYTFGSQSFILERIPTDILLVSINGQGPLKRIDYSVNSSTLTINPPTVLAENSEITVIGVTGGISGTSTGEEKDIFTWNTGDSYVFTATLNIFEAIHLFINGIEYNEGTHYNVTPDSNEFTVTNLVLEDGDVLKLVYKVSAG